MGGFSNRNNNGSGNGNRNGGVFPDEFEALGHGVTDEFELGGIRGGKRRWGDSVVGGSGNGGGSFGAGDAYSLVFSDERLATGVRFIDGSGKTLLGVGDDGEGGRVVLILVLVPVLNERGPAGSVFLYKSSKRKRHYLFYYFLVFGKKKINFFI
jgi:hypothetical protein